MSFSTQQPIWEKKKKNCYKYRMNTSHGLRYTTRITDNKNKGGVFSDDVFRKHFRRKLLVPLSHDSETSQKRTETTPTRQFWGRLHLCFYSDLTKRPSDHPFNVLGLETYPIPVEASCAISRTVRLKISMMLYT